MAKEAISGGSTPKATPAPKAPAPKAPAPKAAAPTFTPAPTTAATSFVGPIPTDATRTATGYTLSNGSAVNPNAGGATKSITNTVDNGDGTVTVTYSDGTTSTSGTKKKKVIQVLQNANGTVTTYYDDGTTDISGTPTTPAASSSTGISKEDKQAMVATALDALRSQLTAAGLSTLVNVLDSAIKDNQTSAQITDTIRNSSEYATRFPGMATLQKKNMAINEATYISMEQGYTQTLHAYGLDTKTYGTTSALGTYIANQVSPSEFNARVDAAANRVNKNPDVMAALQQYYPGASKAGVISYLLDPTTGMDILNKQVRASEIGAAALGSGFTQFDINKNINAMTTAQDLTTQIGSEDLTQLKKEFGAASILNQTQQRLADVESGAYTSDTAIQAAVVGNAQAQLESQRRAQRESQLRFGGQGSQLTRVSTVGSI
jgi:hypothetical protein